MTMRTFLVVVLALVCGGAAALGVNTLRRDQKSAAPPKVETIPVVIAVKDIPRLTPLTAEQVKIREVEKGSMPKGTFTRVEDVVGRVSRQAITGNDYLLEHQLAKLGSRDAATAAIPKGMRAFPIPATKLQGATAGLYQPGDKVDVLFTAKHRTTESPETRTLLSKIEVFAVDQTLEAPESGSKVNVKELRSVHLLVTPAQANDVTTALSEGSLQLTLRNGEDEQLIVAAPKAPVEPKELPTAIRPAAAEIPPTPPPPARVITLRGVQRDSTTWDLR